MSKIIRLILVVALIGLGVWLWTVLFPDPKHVIRNRLNRVAKLASFTQGEGNFHRVLNIQKLGALFSDDAQIMVDVPEYGSHSFTRDEMTQALLGAKRIGDGLQAEFTGMNIEMDNGADSALVDVTLKAKIASQSDLIFQELKFTMKKIKGDWLITHVETVNTLKP